MSSVATNSKTTSSISNGWNQFWFSAANDVEDNDPTVRYLRVGVGLTACLWLLAFTPDLIRWFGPGGWLDARVYHQWVTADLPSWSGRLSFLFFRQPAMLWAAHVISVSVVAAFTFGFQVRWTSKLSWFVVLAYVHRVPVLGGPAELMITMLIGYFAWAPLPLLKRLVQVHLTLVYAAALATKLMAPAWWNGEAIWWLSAQPLNSGLAMTFLKQHPLLLNLWTFMILAGDLAMSTVVWDRRLRRTALILSSFCWATYAVATGSLGVALVMITAGLAFLPSRLIAE